MRLPLLAATLAALFPFPAAAAEAADPAAPVARPAYQSVFQGLPTGVEEATVDWRQANTDVGRFPRGHADILKWEESQGGAKPAAAAPAPAPAAPAPAAPATPGARPPAAHQH